jgi:hypothetical protein
LAADILPARQVLQDLEATPDEQVEQARMKIAA